MTEVIGIVVVLVFIWLFVYIFPRFEGEMKRKRPPTDYDILEREGLIKALQRSLASLKYHVSEGYTIYPRKDRENIRLIRRRLESLDKEVDWEKEWDADVKKEIEDMNL